MTTDSQNRFSDRTRFYVFWAGALMTVSFSVFAYVLTLFNESRAPVWLLFWIIAIPPLAYWVAWIGFGRTSVRSFAIVLYLFGMAPAVLSVILFAMVPGFIALIAGSPDRNQP